MYYRLEKLFYLLLAFVLLNVFFLVSSNSHQVVVDFQSDIKTRIAQAWTQTIGDDPWGVEIGHIYTYTYNFYSQAADSYIALVSFPDVDKQLSDIAVETFNVFKYAIAQTKPEVDEYAQVGLPKELFMKIPPLENVVPSEILAINQEKMKKEQENESIVVSNEGVSSLNFSSRIAEEKEPVLDKDEERVAGSGERREKWSTKIFPRVAGISIVRQMPEEHNLNLQHFSNPWVSLQDPITHKFHCVAIYGGEINRYEGSCVEEYY
jgi:hypothetical protein